MNRTAKGGVTHHVKIAKKFAAKAALAKSCEAAIFDLVFAAGHAGRAAAYAADHDSLVQKAEEGHARVEQARTKVEKTCGVKRRKERLSYYVD